MNIDVYGWNLIYIKPCKTSFDSINSWKLKIYSWKSRPVKLKSKTILTFVCMNLSISRLINLYTRSKLKQTKTESSFRSSFSRGLNPNLIQMSLTSIWVLDAILTRELLNHHVLAPKLNFESFVEVNHLQDLDQYLKLIKHKKISKLTFIS